MKPRKKSSNVLQGLFIISLCLAMLITFMTGRHRATMVLLLCTMVLFWLWGVFSYRRAKNSRNWSPTAARITRIIQMHHYSKYAGRRPYIVVEYQYVVNGVRYNNDLYTQFPWTAERKQNSLASYQQNPMLRIHYNPRKPGQAVEKPGVHGKLISPMSIGLSLFVLAFVSIYWIFIIGGRW